MVGKGEEGKKRKAARRGVESRELMLVRRDIGNVEERINSGMNEERTNHHLDGEWD